MFKNVVMMAWKERWSEQKWTMNMKSLIQPGNTGDVIQMADVLFTQAFTGSTPNNVLLSYFNYGLKSGVFSYAAIFTAISKHEDLQNVTNMTSTLAFLMLYIEKLNKGQILEDSMTLCKALLFILQWLLRNIEQYLNGVQDVSKQDAEEIIRRNCAALHSLTTSRRTASLLTVARFEESSVWSHIETDLAVIKGEAVNQKSVHNDVMMSCNSVSQLARCHTKTLAIYPMEKVFGTETHHSMLLNMMILLEGEWNKTTDHDTLMQQALLIAQLCDMNVKDVCLDLIRACMLGFVGNADGKMKHKWSAMLFLTLPEYLCRLKSIVPSNSGSEITIRQDHGDFESALVDAFSELLHYGSLLDMLDQVTANTNCFCWLVERCVSFDLLTEIKVEDLKLKRQGMQTAPSQHPLPAIEPSKLPKYKATAMQLLTILNTNDYTSNQETLLSTLNQIWANFDVIVASGSSQNVQNFAQKLMAFNDTVKINPKQGENVKSAQTRCLLFDFTFFFICGIAEQYGKNAALSSFSCDDETLKPFMWQWISYYWPDDRLSISQSSINRKLEVDDKRVKVFIDMLQSIRDRTQEQSPSLVKWHDYCINLTRAFLEMIKALYCKYITKADLVGACDVICKNLSLGVRLSCLVEASRFSLSVSNEFNTSLKDVFYKLLSRPSSTGQDLHIEKRYSMFKNAAAILLKDSNPSAFRDVDSELLSTSTITYPMDVFCELLSECRQSGWIDSKLQKKFTAILDQSGPQWFVRQIVSQLLKQTRKDVVDRTAIVMSGLMQLDLESCTICLLRHEIPHYLTNGSHHLLLSAPAGNALAKLTVSCLAVVLQNLSLQQKGCLPPKSQKQKLDHEYFVSGIEAPMLQQGRAHENGGPSKLRRLFSVTAEHDLASGAFSSILGDPQSLNISQSRSARVTDQPLLRALSYALDIMHMSLEQHQPGPHIDFIVQFVYLASCCGVLVSQAVLQFMPLSMVSELAALVSDEGNASKIRKLDANFDNLRFCLSVSDLGHGVSRKIAAKTICQMQL